MSYELHVNFKMGVFFILQVQVWNASYAKWVLIYRLILRCEFIFYFVSLDLKCELNKTIYQLQVTFNSFMMEITII